MKRVAKWGLGLGLILGLPIIGAVGFWLYVASTLPPIESLTLTNTPSCLENPEIQHVKIHDLPEYVTSIFVVAEAPQFLRQRFIPSLRMFGKIVVGQFDQSYNPSDLKSFTEWVTQTNMREIVQERHDLFAQFQKLVQSDRIEMSLGKLEILEIYFNQTYFAKGTIGIACASQHFFRKRPENLTIAETALLAALARSPTNFDLITKPTFAEQRRNTIIDEVLAAGFISSSEAATAKAAPLQQQ